MKEGLRSIKGKATMNRWSWTLHVKGHSRSRFTYLRSRCRREKVTSVSDRGNSTGTNRDILNWNSRRQTPSEYYYGLPVRTLTEVPLLVSVWPCMCKHKEEEVVLRKEKEGRNTLVTQTPKRTTVSSRQWLVGSDRTIRRHFRSDQREDEDTRTSLARPRTNPNIRRLRPLPVCRSPLCGLSRRGSTRSH